MNRWTAKRARAIAKVRIMEKKAEQAKRENLEAQKQAILADRVARNLLAELERRSAEAGRTDLDTAGVRYPPAGDKSNLIALTKWGSGLYLSPTEARQVVDMIGPEEARNMGIPDSIIYTDPPTGTKQFKIEDWT